MSNPSPFLQGLIAATFTPLHEDGSLDLAAISPMVDHLVDLGINGLYVLGSTGEGVSLTFDERRRAAESFVAAAAKRIPVIVQVGCESLAQARLLATHAAEAGADAVSAVGPLYFKPDSVQSLVDSMQQIASGAPSLPFYYYHIPTVTGISVGMLDFLAQGEKRIPNLRGIKFTSANVAEFQACVEFADDRLEILWGLDEMLLAGLAAGARAAVGSTYNFAAPVYQRLLAAYRSGDFEEARRQQSRSQAIVRAFVPYGPRSAQKAIMKMVGSDCGPPRLPLPALPSTRYDALQKDLEAIGFFEWLAEAG